jgi:hypothetical protein
MREYQLSAVALEPPVLFGASAIPRVLATSE